MIDRELEGWEDRPRICSRAIILPPWMCHPSSEGVHGNVRAKHDGEGIQRRPVAKPRPSRSQELVLTAHGQNADYSHFEQNRNGQSFLKDPLPWALTGLPARVI
jgi:hypothetical protein